MMPPRFLPYLLLTLAVLFWSGNFVIGRGVHELIPPIALSFWRWLIALIILLPFAIRLAWQERRLIIEHGRFLWAQGALGVAGFNTLVYIGLQTTGTINAVVVNSTIPVIIVFISYLIYGERISLRQGLGGLISFLGVVWIISRGAPADLFGLHANSGDLWVLAAAVTWASYSVFLRHYPEGLHPLVFLLSIMVTGLICLVPFYAWEHWSGRTIQFDATTLLSILYVALFASVLAFICWNRAVRWVGANRAGIFVHLMPVFATILAIIFLDERLQTYHLLGIVAVALGIALTTWISSANKKLAAAETQD